MNDMNVKIPKRFSESAARTTLRRLADQKILSDREKLEILKKMTDESGGEKVSKFFEGKEETAKKTPKKQVKVLRYDENNNPIPEKPYLPKSVKEVDELEELAKFQELAKAKENAKKTTKDKYDDNNIYSVWNESSKVKFKDPYRAKSKAKQKLSEIPAPVYPKVPKVKRDFKSGDNVCIRKDMSAEDWKRVAYMTKSYNKTGTVVDYVTQGYLCNPKYILTIASIRLTQKTATEYAVIDLLSDKGAKLFSFRYAIQTRYLKLKARMPKHPGTSIFMQDMPEQ